MTYFISSCEPKYANSAEYTFSLFPNYISITECNSNPSDYLDVNIFKLSEHTLYVVLFNLYIIYSIINLLNVTIYKKVF